MNKIKMLSLMLALVSFQARADLNVLNVPIPESCKEASAKLTLKDGETQVVITAPADQLPDLLKAIEEKIAVKKEKTDDGHQ